MHSTARPSSHDSSPVSPRAHAHAHAGPWPLVTAPRTYAPAHGIAHYSGRPHVAVSDTSYADYLSVAPRLDCGERDE